MSRAVLAEQGVCLQAGFVRSCTATRTAAALSNTASSRCARCHVTAAVQTPAPATAYNSLPSRSPTGAAEHK